MKFQIIPKSCFNLKTYIDNIDNKRLVCNSSINDNEKDICNGCIFFISSVSSFECLNYMYIHILHMQ